MSPLLDTNILIDFLNGIDEAREELDNYRDPAISIVTWMEVLVGATAQDESLIRGFLDAFEVVALDRDVAEIAIGLRRARAIKLPDAIIWASAQATNRLLVSRNARDFPEADPGVRIPYVLG